jgi:hypothetical protein
MAEGAPVSRPPNPRLERTGRGRPLSRQPLGRVTRELMLRTIASYLFSSP